SCREAIWDARRTGPIRAPAGCASPSSRGPPNASRPRGAYALLSNRYENRTTEGIPPLMLPYIRAPVRGLAQKENAMEELKSIIEAAGERRTTISPASGESKLKSAVGETIDLLDRGVLRVAEKKAGGWITHEWAKKA